jgi:hypothetical protein
MTVTMIFWIGFSGSVSGTVLVFVSMILEWMCAPSPEACYDDETIGFLLQLNDGIVSPGLEREVREYRSRRFWGRIGICIGLLGALCVVGSGLLSLYASQFLTFE